MKVLLVNGSGHAKGCTYTALEEVAGALEKNGIETEIIQVGTQPIAGCIGCNACLKNGKCFREDGVNEFVEKAKTARICLRISGALCICFRYDHFLPGQSILRQERPVPGQARCLHRQLQTRWGFRSL